MGTPDQRLDGHKEPLKLATATLVAIIAKARELQSAVIRSAPGEEIERLRAETHDMLDAYLDLNTEAAIHVRALLP